MGAIAQGFLVVGGSVLIALLGMELVRRLPSALVIEEQHIAGHFYGSIDRLYGVLLAFIVVLVWGQFQDGKVIVTREANQIGDLSRMAKAFPEPVEHALRRALINYTQTVIDDEWPAMAHHEQSQRSWVALEQVWDTMRQVQPTNDREKIYLERALFRLNELSDSRRLRLLASEDKVPGVLWGLLAMGGGITIFSSYFFRLSRHAAQALMTAFVAGLIGFILFLIISLDSPFAGTLRVGPDALRNELQRMQNSAME